MSMFSQKWDEICNDGEEEFNELLAVEGVTIQDLLDNENCIEQLENGNKQLLKFLDNPNNFMPLIEYVTIMPNGDDAKRAFRYPYYACQILKDPQNFIYSKLLDEDYLTKILAVLSNPLNEVLAGYLYQILENLATHRINEFLHYFLTHDMFLDQIFKLSEWHSISQCLMLFLKIDPDALLKNINLQFIRQQILNRILAEMIASNTKSNFRDILISLCDIKDNYEGDLLLEELINNSDFHKIASFDFNISVKFLGTLFPQTSFKQGECSDKHVSWKSFNKKLMKINSISFQKTLINCIKDNLKEYVQRKVIKFKVSDLEFFIMMQRLSYANSEIVTELFGQIQLWLDLIKCIGNYPATNMMHIEVVKIIRNGVGHHLSEVPQPQQGNKEIVEALIEEFQKDRVTTNLYFGYLLQVAFQLKKFATEVVEEQGIKSIFKVELWSDFETKFLLPEFERGNTPIDDQRLIDSSSPLNIQHLQIKITHESCIKFNNIQSSHTTAVSFA